MTKENLINRIKIKASSRKRLLFALYQTLICSFENASIIVDEINRDLGIENLITVSDIYYCRRHFAKKRALKNNNSINESINLPVKNTNKKEMKWTDPTTIPKLTLRSKFEKSDE